MRKTMTTMLSAMLAAGLLMTGTAARADAEVKFDDFYKVADKNKDGMMTRQEFLDAMGARYDAMMVKMKAMPEAKTMIKDNMMSKEATRQFLEDIARLAKGA